MCIINRCRQLLTSVITKDIVNENRRAFTIFNLTRKARNDTSFCQRRFITNTRQQWYQQSAFQILTKRHCSELLSETNRFAAEFKGKTEELENDTSSMDNLRSMHDFNLDVMVALLRQENAVDICVIKIPEINYSDYFIVVSGISPRHIRAMAHYAIKVQKFMKKNGDRHAKIEGKDAEDWLCIDFGTMVVHFMLPETREVYELEKLWTLRSYDEQLRSLPSETLPEDFIYGLEDTK